MVFEDRRDAGKKLAKKLMPYKRRESVVFGLPRGGVVTAYEVAKTLGLSLDVLVVRKIGMPFEEEFGIGAIGENGASFLDQEVIEKYGVSAEAIKSVIKREHAELKRRLRLYRNNKPLPDIKGKTAIVVDDGVATGVTARVAVESLRALKPEKIIVAVPVCAKYIADMLSRIADEVVCLETPDNLSAIGLWYRNFTQVSDDDVINLLARSNR